MLTGVHSIKDFLAFLLLTTATLPWGFPHRQHTFSTLQFHAAYSLLSALTYAWNFNVTLPLLILLLVLFWIALPLFLHSKNYVLVLLWSHYRIYQLLGLPLAFPQMRHVGFHSCTVRRRCVKISASGFRHNFNFYRTWLLALRPTPQPGGPASLSGLLIWPRPLDLSGMGAPVRSTPPGIALRAGPTTIS